MGKRDLLFIGLCLVGAVAFAGQLWRPPRVEPPRDYRSLAQADPDFRAVVEKIDAEFEQSWRSKGLATAPIADDLTLARRLSLGLTGTIPSLEEIRALEKVPDENRVSWWIGHLLEDRRYSDYVAERLARAWVGTDDGPFLVYRRRRFVAWISDRLHRNDQRYDQIVRHLIGDEGLWTDSPAVNFVTVTANPANENQPDPIRLANRTSRAFLGMRIDCLQCHDDRLDKVFLGTPDAPRDGQQQDFHRLAAFFVDTRNSPVGIRDKKQSEGYRYKFLHDEEESKVEPGVPFQDDLAPSDGRLRRQLAAWVTHPENKPFARATVNRFWALVCGRPLVEPIDEVPLHGPFPPGLEALADDFIAHNYDVRRLIRVIASTAAFRHDSRAECDITPEHEKHWAVFPLTRLRPEQVAGGVIQASSLSTIDADAHIVRKLIKFGQTNEFVKRYGDTGEDEFDDRGGTIPQRLLLMNGEMVTERIGENIVFNAATRIAALTQNNERAVEATYLSVLSRRPTEEELKFFVAKLEAARNRDRREAVEDLWWILINSTEFSWNH